ncbi:RagB/SusD family nutrient uptake outer membrane protein [Chitinophaga sancti]|uniref:RagB/SusD family nutrient uptake outer membrane protein n=1 Tax=Chitinophaga sancti TaxID=1004 RepID=A0A1K1NJL7_9BACT|nr:RagB/SusD family nutrient uptake outer membrane protein [Chitinophaga sancti]WQD63231.1 RagB/SusD family nutrient uptake outer membrane protein [Chitinophaga sancti]WQG91143.1 RagB/SusD family nutrient uptake outer membrane protein [Chitinophaga sancti]SFW34606.1 Starch-binding associating with outer membrane [Chitinophaga sancti]
MQKLTIYIIILLVLSACSKDFLNTKIDSSATDKTLNSNYSTLISLGNAPYAYIRNGFLVLDNINIFASATDEAEQTSALSTSRYFNQGSWNATTNPDNFYASYYMGIRAANYFLEHSVNYKDILGSNRDTISASGNISYKNDVVNVAWYRAEAHILRAYFYFELTKRYGGVPLVKRVLDANENTILPAAPYDSVMSFVINEVDLYKDSLQVNWKTSSFSNYDGRFTKGVALALKARALLYWASPLHNTGGDVQRWQKAAAAAHDVIAMGLYSLSTDYRNYFLQNNTLSSGETILALRKAASNTMETQNYPISTSGGLSGVTPSENLVADYEYTGTPDAAHPYANRDPRLGMSIVTNGSTWNGRVINEAPGGTDDMANTNASKTGYYLKKFVNDGLNLVQGGTVTHHWVIMRYGEVLLEYAEAMNEAYGPDNDNGYGMTARAAINMVRARTGVNMPAVTAANQDEFRTALKHERKIELAFEDYRYWDLLRWKDAATALNKPLLGVKVNNGVYSTFTVEERVFDASKMYYYPFPQTEISISKGVLVQNPGW